MFHYLYYKPSIYFLNGVVIFLEIPNQDNQDKSLVRHQPCIGCASLFVSMQTDEKRMQNFIHTDAKKCGFAYFALKGQGHEILFG